MSNFIIFYSKNFFVQFEMDFFFLETLDTCDTWFIVNYNIVINP